MKKSITNSSAQICAMCQYWNGLQGGRNVKPCVNDHSFLEFDPEEAQICYKDRVVKKGWDSCLDWVGRY